MTKPFEKKTYFAMTLDPVHIGTGGYRLGRVDNTITREPGTNLPKIPGSSIAGVTRAYTAMAIQNENYDSPVKTDEGWVIDYRKYKKWKYQRPEYDFMMDGSNIKYSTIDKDKVIIKPNTDGPIIKKDSNNNDRYYSCAGKGADDGEGHCGEPDCEVCISFGFSKGKSGSSFQGLAQFYDARILFFPVHSMVGPVWVTSPSVLNDFCETLKSQSITVTIEDRLDNDEFIQTDLVKANENLNLGWLLLKNKEELRAIKDPIPRLSTEIVNRVVLISDKLFSRIINDNLEVRTSVAIDPATGAAEDGALYTYEAIPRATVMWFDVVYNDPDYFRIGADKAIALIEPTDYHDPLRNPGGEDQVGYMVFNVEKGLAYLEHLGVGGMNTRGMGRFRILNMGGDKNGNS